MIGLDEQKKISEKLNIFLCIILNICCGCSKERSQQEGSFEYPQHMFWLRKKKSIFFITILILRPGYYHGMAQFFYHNHEE